MSTTPRLDQSSTRRRPRDNKQLISKYKNLKKEKNNIDKDYLDEIEFAAEELERLEKCVVCAYM
ncbi:hypothetical protein FACS189472_09600 [Alphaproteobacteria bacterium]|nr:hypothetical protein FACS189472_09600 [Alphaproteobacteria bacterium]